MKAILGPAGKIRVYVAKLENSSPHDGGVKHGGERGEEKVKELTIFRGRGTASRVPRGTSGSGVDKYISQHLRMDTAALSGVRNSEERISCG